MSLETTISKRIGKAIFNYKMIEEGDKILVAVSGGKDSVTLLNDLVKRQRSFPIKYTLVAVHIQTDFCTCCDKNKLAEYFESLGVEYIIKDVGVIKRLKPGFKMNCYWCSNQRRLELMKIAGEIGASKVALGHHLDDIAETLLMNICFKGEIAGMLPKFKYDKFGGIIIRPLAYVKEELIIKLANEKGTKQLVCTCPYGKNSSRKSVRSQISELAKIDPSIRENILKSMHNVKDGFLLDPALKKEDDK